jgi:hypothetical protein
VEKRGYETKQEKEKNHLKINSDSLKRIQQIDY